MRAGSAIQSYEVISVPVLFRPAFLHITSVGLFFAPCYLLCAFMASDLALLFFRWVVPDRRGRCRHEESVKLSVTGSARMQREDNEGRT